MVNVLQETNFNFPHQTNFYRGKVRDVYSIGAEQLLMVASDRISAFDVVLPRAIPYKGQVLNQIAAYFLENTADIIPNWLISTPDPNVSVGIRCEAFPIEMVVRNYLVGHAWREYRSGKRSLCGVGLPDNLRENDQFPYPIITPTTKAKEGHDADISKEDIIAQGLVSQLSYIELENKALALFERGTIMAAKQGLILADTKYEFGEKDGVIYLIDEIHTPDSSRYFYAEGYLERQKKQEPQKQLSKEFVREWLIANDFQGKNGQQIPEMTDDKVIEISERYIELYEKVTGKIFEKSGNQAILQRIEQNIINFLS